MLMFRKQDRERVAAGEITVTYRLWKSARVKAGRSYETGFGAVEVEDVRVVPAALVTAGDARLAGLPSPAAVWALAGDHTGAEVGPETLLYRVQFRFLGRDSRPQRREAKALTPGEVRQRLAAMDARSARGPWTLQALRFIRAGPEVPARVLAAEMGWETQDFKAHIRRLKALGLTISHEVGYELSDLGREYLASLERG
ncbi:MAG TPA: ASCH domain-containing protein [Dehalococcoidia bacterium]|nr:ASCH domain-containing protein [Dehalococcoidia bacterium]